MRYFFAFAIALTAILGHARCQAQFGFLSQSEAHRHGLQRAWVTHVALDRTRDRLTNVVLDGPHLFVQTDRSLLQVLDAETGGRVWTAQVGNRNYPTSPPAANDKYVALLNGTTLYVLDRTNGRTLREERTRWVPSGVISLADDWAYVPTLNSQLEVFGLRDPKLKWNCGSAGAIDMPPLVARNALVWGTSKGFVNFASLNAGQINFRLQSNGSVTAPLGYWPPLVMAASRDGYLYAIHERTGDTMWRYSLGTAVNETPIAIGGTVYVIPEQGGMHALACTDGTVRWYSPKATHLLAVTPTYVYATDRLGNTLVLDVQTGGHVDTLTTWHLPVKYTNIENDRLFFGSGSGVLMCLHELSLAKPIQHLLPEEGPKDKPATEGDMGQPANPSVPAAGDPFGGAPPQQP